MKKEIKVTETPNGADLTEPELRHAQVVFYFISPDFKGRQGYMANLMTMYPDAKIIGCTTGGEIVGSDALNGAAVSVALLFKHAKVEAVAQEIPDENASFDVGVKIGQGLKREGLRYIFVLSEGLQVNGTELTSGLVESVGPDVIISGGLAGDGSNFKTTGVGLDGPPKSNTVAAVGFYGDSLQVSYGTYGGWQKFGPNRKITKSYKNVLFELDNKPALDLYKAYLGEEADKLPVSGLLFPLCVRAEEGDPHEVVRTIVSVNEDDKSLIFTGEIPQGYIAQLMHGSIEKLVDGAEQAAESALQRFTGQTDNALAILVSCVGRNLLMGQQTADELVAVRGVLGKADIAGFYSYGEISHHPVSGKCGLHNQTMTISLISEKV